MVNSTGTFSEFVSEGDWTPLGEAVVGEDGTIPIKIIGPGWSLNGRYYSEKFLREAAALYTAGTKDFWNHPGPVQLREQPSGDLNALAAVLSEDARYLDEGDEGAFDGSGLYARVKPVGQYRDRIVELAPFIGVSHRVVGRQKMGEAEGRRGMLVESINRVISVDFVATPAAGGAVMAEAEEEHEDMTENLEEAVAAAVAPLNEAIATKDATIATLTEQVGALTAELGTVKQAAVIAEAAAIRSDELAKSALPDAAKARVDVPIGESFDADAYRAAIVEAIATEAAYIASVMAAKPVDGTGVSIAEGDGALAIVRELRAATGR